MPCMHTYIYIYIHTLHTYIMYTALFFFKKKGKAFGMHILVLARVGQCNTLFFLICCIFLNDEGTSGVGVDNSCIFLNSVSEARGLFYFT